jgi:hypothetical protein
MGWNLVRRTGLLLAVGLVWTLSLSGQDTTPTSTLVGVWKAKRDFGPAIRGTLDIARSNDNHPSSAR